MWSPMVAVPVIQVMVPSATRPASLSMVSARAATRTGGASTLAMSSGAKALVVTRSPSQRTVSPRSSGISDVRYSLHVGGRALVAHAPHPLDHHLVGQADAEEEPVARRHLHGEGLLGQHHRVPRVHRHHPRAQADAGHLGAGDGQERQRIGPEDLGREGVVEPGFVVAPQEGHDLGRAACPSQSCSRCAAAWPCPWCSSRSLPVVSAPLSRRIPARGRAT